VPAVDLFALLSRHKELFVRFGGHLLAAGATIEKSAFETVKEALNTDLSEQFPMGLPELQPVIEDRLSLSEITPKLAREITYLAPFGDENRTPLFLIEGTLSGVRRIGRDGSHLMARLSDAAASVRIVSFGSGARYADWSAIDSAKAFVSIEPNTYQGRADVSVRAEAIERSVEDGVKSTALTCIRTIRYGLPLPDQATLDRLPKLTEEEIRAVFRSLSDRLKIGTAIESLSERELTALLPLYEIGVVQVRNGMFFTETVQEKKQIQKAPLYPVLCLR
jgi:Single-stranded DNA-specific exonuclease